MRFSVDFRKTRGIVHIRGSEKQHVYGLRNGRRMSAKLVPSGKGVAMNARAVGIWGLAIAAAAVCSPAPAEPPAQNKPTPAQPAQPVRPGTPGFLDPNLVGTRYAKGEHEFVSPEQREALGLDDTSWTKQHGKVHPDVYAALEKAEQVKEPWRDPVGFSGTVYVQVQLKHEPKGKADSPDNKAAIKQLETKLLSRLSAAEFYVEYPLQSQAAILGYATRQGIEKLKADADVLAVGLDSRPFPQRPDPVTKDDLPAPKPGDSARGGDSDARVEPDVYRALALHGRVFVRIGLAHKTVDEAREREVGRGRAIDEAALRALTADDFWVQYRTAIHSRNRPVLMGVVTREGLEKLIAQPDVDSVRLDRRTYAIP